MSLVLIGNSIRCLQARPGLPMIGLCFLVLLGCDSTTRIASHQDPSDDRQPPTYEEIVAAHNARVVHLQKTSSYGVLELKWEDEQGVHSEPQVDVDLWFDLPSKTAIRVNKLGEVYFWVGSDENDLWMFDLLSKNHRFALICNRDDEAALESISAFGIQPDSLLDLMALRLLPDVPSDENTIAWAPQPGAWAVSGLGEEGRTRIFFEDVTWRPIRVELLSNEGQVLLHSTLSHYASVFRPGVSPLSFAKQAMWIDIVDVAGKGFAKIHLNEMTSDVDDVRLSRVFDLQRLIRSLRPDRIEGNPSSNSTP